MKPPSPLISWVNPFPSRFINRTACFPRKVSYFRESRMSPWKKWSWMKSNSEARPSTVFLFCYTSIFTILQPLGSGDHEINVNELSDWDWAWRDGTKAANWGSCQGYLCECFLFFLPLYIPHVSMHFEKKKLWKTRFWLILSHSADIRNLKLKKKKLLQTRILLGYRLQEVINHYELNTPALWPLNVRQAAKI